MDGVRRVLTQLRKIDELEGLRKVFEQGHSVSIRGPVASGAAVVTAALLKDFEDHCLALCPGVEYAEDFAEDINLFRPGLACHFPALEIMPGDEEAPNEEILTSRLAVLRHLVFGTNEPSAAGLLGPQPETRIVCAGINALLQPVCDAESLKNGSRALSVGDQIGPHELVEWLVDAGFYSVPRISEPGQYSLRGGILDIFSHGAEKPVRVEFFGDQIDSLRTFDCETQISRQRIELCELTAPTDPLANQSVGQESLLSYIDNPIVFIVESARVWHRAQELSAGEMQNFYNSASELQSRVEKQQQVKFLAEDQESDGDQAHNIECQHRDVFGVDVDDALKELDRLSRECEKTYLFSMSSAEEDRLRKLLDDRDLAAAGRVRFRRGRLNHGAVFATGSLALVPHHRLFGRYRQRRLLHHAEKTKPVIEAAELRPGDTVVHVQHGIGRFRGLRILEKEGRRREHLEIEFADNARIYVPSQRVEMVHRYIGVGGRRPTLSKLRGRSWRRAREKAEGAVEDLASELLRIQAVRQTKSGIAFPSDNDWQQQFEAEFPYEETEDQLRTIEDVKSDMEADRPMDRLVCGDVGYGKTEVAMRAAFKCVMGERQCAMLVPTTVLAQQHFWTFSDRMADYPIRIEMLSRFITPAQSREIVEDMADGKVDIVIGTHRLLQDDVRFKDLGLIIIDEEQRFGVRHKETLKQMRASVDVLTLTATPIPRTLHMSLMGLRDISALQTAPRSRQAIETRVRKFDPQLLTHAIQREMNREGQVYLVHNRVNSIDKIADKLRKLVPEATVAIAHGQMPERQLATAMERFTDGEVDVLVSTTIIENGLDIPNANTLIVNRAELLGLAEMHQLRGRVGRYIHKAYAYFFTPPDRPITPEARKRLDAIRRYSRLGAGFDIALRDLELRGAGNILGPEQSGHVAAVGYNLYCRLLSRATARLKGEAVEEPPVTTVNIGLDLYVPEQYMPALQQRVAFYRKASEATKLADIDAVKRELRDRYGPIPEPVQNLLLEAEIRILADKAGVDSIHLRDHNAEMTLRDPGKFKNRVVNRRGELKMIDQDLSMLILPDSADSPRAIGDFLKSFLENV
ncbi:MAG: transcription-repair coupling factor [Planctomycetes bacterium]|nr:transcription-repair coupling factor [Planctomycetota bacterium]